ncbi:MAG: histidinol-phosphate transaminase [Candidatus Calescibacterium sp.]|jgi:histidinol-phosphate aminotransferase
MKEFVKPVKSIENLQPYKLVSHKAWELTYKKDHHNAKKVIKLDWNESTHLPRHILKEVLRYIINHQINLNWYPDTDNKILKEKIAKYISVSVDNIQYFNGSDSALEYICRAYIDNKDKVIIVSPTYDNFRIYVEACGGVIKRYYNSNPFTKDIDKLAKFIKEIKPKMLYLVNPNNPTGVLYDKEEIEFLIKRFPRTLFVIDEAYYEFCGRTVVELVNNFSNIIITRSFTKAFGLGAFRLGYVIADKNIIDVLNKIRVGKGINTFAQIAGIIALDNKEYMEKYVEEVNKSKEYLNKKLKELGVQVIITPANFILVRCKKPSYIVAELEKHNVFVRDLSHLPSLENYIRITVGDLSTMKKFFNIFKKVYEQNESCFI